MSQVIILDRDGTINQDRDDYVKSADEWIPLPGALEAIARLTKAGYRIAVATNQSGLARGLFNMDALDAMHHKMRSMAAALGGHIDTIFYCGHGPDDGCDCRKPRPGLMYQVARHYGIDLSDVPVVGDTVRDLEAGAAAGCAPHLVLTGKAFDWRTSGIPKNKILPEETMVHHDLSAFVDFWLT